MPTARPLLAALLMAAAPAACTTAPRSDDAPADTGAAGNAARGGPGAPTASAPVTLTRILAATQSGFDTPQQLVLRDAAAWQAAWARLHQGDAPPLPAVDFAREMVVLVALGTRGTGGFAVRVDSVAAAGGGATVRYTVSEPGPGCMTTQALTAPVDVVRAPRAEGAVRFDPRTVREPC